MTNSVYSKIQKPKNSGTWSWLKYFYLSFPSSQNYMILTLVKISNSWIYPSSPGSTSLRRTTRTYRYQTGTFLTHLQGKRKKENPNWTYIKKQIDQVPHRNFPARLLANPWTVANFPSENEHIPFLRAQNIGFILTIIPRMYVYYSYWYRRRLGLIGLYRYTQGLNYGV